MENPINRDILDNSFYMISLFENAKVKDYDDGIDKSSLSTPLAFDEGGEESKDFLYIRNNRKNITNLKLQKLMYFVEIYYMVKETYEKELFDSNWSAWDYGPVNQTLYNYFKKFGSLDIAITDDERKKGDAISSINKEYIQRVYRTFGGLSAFDLVTLTHLKNSPWYKIRNSNSHHYNFQKLNDSVIDKKESVEWFKKTFPFLNDEKCEDSSENG